MLLKSFNPFTEVPTIICVTRFKYIFYVCNIITTSPNWYSFPDIIFFPIDWCSSYSPSFVTLATYVLYFPKIILDF